MVETSESLSIIDGIDAVLDEHLLWFGQWQRLVFYGVAAEDGEPSLPPTATFLRWCQAASREELAKQPAIERLVRLHEQMHRLARVILLRATADRARPSAADYESVAGRYEEFMIQLRRIGRAFSAAAAGLDPLTGLRSRRDMQAELEREYNRFTRTGQPFCLAICDIDFFKSVNDRFGHDIGDRVLAAVATCINRGIRSFDEAFRMGGEEFLICLKDAAMADGFAVIERLRCDLALMPIDLSDGTTLTVTASFGLIQAQTGVAIDDMVVNADRALYQAKNSGRNRVVRYGTDGRGPAPPRARAR
ncbi:MAG: diguanylate cyclase [Azospirillum sp.]|nr:diguanylate cyclase [Azospirillum sp.]